MREKKLISIGEFAKMVGIDRKTLIFYDNEGVLKPAAYGKENGYRYYSFDQYDEVHAIVTLRMMGISLTELKQHLQERNAASSIEVIKRRKKQVDKFLDELKLEQRRLRNRLSLFEKLNCVRADECFIEHCSEEYLSLSDFFEGDGDAEFDNAYEEIEIEFYNFFMKHNDGYPLGSYMKLDEYIDGKDIFAYTFKTDRPITAGKSFVKPAGKYAVCFHYGDFLLIKDVADKVLQYIKDSGLTGSSDIFQEIYLDEVNTENRAEFAYSISVRVE